MRSGPSSPVDDMDAATLLIRADANPQMGNGHVMRCLALAQCWRQSSGRAWFALARPAGPIRERLESAGFEVRELPCASGGAEDATATAALAREQGAAWVVVDGYQFDAGYQRRIKEAGPGLLVLDDFGHAGHYFADYVVNPNPGATDADYAGREPGTRLLLGPRYVLLRQEFLKWRNWERKAPVTGRKILVSLGGSDPENVTLKVAEALAGLADCEITVVVGSNSPHWPRMQTVLSRQAPRIRLVRDTPRMPELMAEADLVVAAGGSTAWEVAFMGLPALLVTLAANQRANVRELVRSGAALELGPMDVVSREEIARAAGVLLADAAVREAMTRAGRALIDGAGSSRVWLHLHESSLVLREVTGEDCRLAWKWANDPGVRSASFFPDPIPWEDHVRWFAAKRAEAGTCYWIACDRAARPVGQVRFENREGATVISVSLGPEHRGRSLGPLVIWLACRRLFRERAVDTVDAWIKPENGASVRAFHKAGFERAGAAVANGQPALVFRLSRDRVEP